MIYGTIHIATNQYLFIAFFRGGLLLHFMWGITFLRSSYESKIHKLSVRCIDLDKKKFREIIQKHKFLLGKRYSVFHKTLVI